MKPKTKIEMEVEMKVRRKRKGRREKSGVGYLEISPVLNRQAFPGPDPSPHARHMVPESSCPLDLALLSLTLSYQDHRGRRALCLSAQALREEKSV